MTTKKILNLFKPNLNLDKSKRSEEFYQIREKIAEKIKKDPSMAKKAATIISVMIKES